jgi:hypothetical protein
MSKEEFVGLATRTDVDPCGSIIEADSIDPIDIEEFMPMTNTAQQLRSQLAIAPTNASEADIQRAPPTPGHPMYRTPNPLPSAMNATNSGEEVKGNREEGARRGRERGKGKGTKRKRKPTGGFTSRAIPQSLMQKLASSKQSISFTFTS